MEGFIRSDVVVIHFPFSDLTQLKRRPALVLSTPPGNDLILCQITSQNIKDAYSVTLSDKDFDNGRLNKPSNVRPNRLFTADENIVLYKVGNINPYKMDAVLNTVIGLFK